MQVTRTRVGKVQVTMDHGQSDRLSETSQILHDILETSQLKIEVSNLILLVHSLTGSSSRLYEAYSDS